MAPSFYICVYVHRGYYIYMYMYVCMYTGAIREVWRSELRRQMSQRLAEERKAIEETRKFYNEEVPDEEDEAEFTGET